MLTVVASQCSASSTAELSGAEVPMVLIPAGPFEMGSANGEPDEQPVHTVILDEYFIDQYEVTNAQYAVCVDANQCNPPAKTSSESRANYFDDPQYGNFPVIQVTWADAQTYCQWRGGRLPTEAEWEKAARGTDGRQFPWGDTFAPGQLNYCDSNCPLPWADPTHNDGYEDTAPVGSYPVGVSPYGVHDMAGNVWEWAADWYAPDYYATSPAENATGPSAGNQRVTRGGGWVNDAYFLRTSTRRRFTPDVPSNSVGFRCARSP